MPLLIFSLLFFQSCFSYVVQNELPIYNEKSLQDDEIEILYRSGDKFRGKKDMSYGIYYSNDDKPQMGYSKDKEDFKYKDGRPFWCYSGDCYNGEGIVRYDSEVKKPDFIKSNYYLNKFNIKFSGKFKNFKEFNGQYILYRNEYKNDKYTDKEYIVYSLKNGELTETKEFLSFQKMVDKEDIERDEIDAKYQKRRREELSQFINKMFTVGARDLNSCIRLCNKYNIVKDCNSKCQDAMNSNR